MQLFAAIRILAVALVAAPFTRASDSLSIELHNSIIHTAATSVESSQYSDVSVGPSSTDESFADDLQKQWKANEGLGDDVAAPYLVCDFTAGTGRSRVEHINSLCDLPDIGDHSVQNLPDRTCVNAQLLYADAKKCAAKSEFIAVVPHTAWTKISYEALTAGFGDGFNTTMPNQVAIETARYAGIICPGDSESIKTRRSEAKNALMRDFKSTEKCAATVPSVRGYMAKFGDIFTLTFENSRLKLHQKDGVFVNYECLMALVASLAEHPFVCNVEHDPPVVLFNDNARWIMQGNVGSNSNKKLPFHDAGIKGFGQTVQMSDTGLSVQSCYFYDSNGEVVRDKSATVDRSKRKVVQYYAKSDQYDDNGHGTHCAGTILGEICTGTGCTVNGVNRDGSAPEAKIAVYDIGGSGPGVSPDDADPMFVRGMSAFATVHSASWGNGDNSYQTRDRKNDKFQYDNPSFLVVFAAGNSGGSKNSGRYNIKNTSSGVAKNNLNVCATNNHEVGLGQSYTAYFSSMGPSQDGRMKPDICAPGMKISSAKNSRGRTCSSQTYSGTSMACPGVAGSALLLRQFFMEGFYPTGTKNSADSFTPTGYLIKAAILNSGRAVLGRDNDGEADMFPSTPYDESQGFGLISLIDAVYLNGESKAKVLVWDQVELENGKMWEETITIGSCDTQQTSVTMTYFDKEGAVGCSTCMTNRLDLTVMNNGQTLYPNGKTGHDTKNNVQRVRFETGNDSITVRVYAKNLITASQKFAVVVSGCVDSGSRHPAHSPGPSKISSPAPSKSISQTPTAAPTCFEDPNFAITRGFKKKQLKRTCKYFGEKKWRKKKWCNKRYRGQLISEICCVTCAPECTQQEILMKEYYARSGQTITTNLPAVINNVQQVRGTLRCTYTTNHYVSGDFILQDASGNQLYKMNFHCGGQHGTDVTKSSEVFDMPVDGVKMVSYKSSWNSGYYSDFMAICTDVNGKEIEVPLK